MLSIENTKQKLQRGEQRLGRIQAKLEQRAGRLHDLEKKLEDIRAQSAPPADQGSVESDQPASHNGSSPIGQRQSAWTLTYSRQPVQARVFSLSGLSVAAMEAIIQPLQENDAPVIEQTQAAEVDLKYLLRKRASKLRVLCSP